MIMSTIYEMIITQTTSRQKEDIKQQSQLLQIKISTVSQRLNKVLLNLM